MRSSQLIEFFKLSSPPPGADIIRRSCCGAARYRPSQVVNQAAAACNLPVIDIRLSQMEPTDLRGIPFHDGKQWFGQYRVYFPMPNVTARAAYCFWTKLTPAPPSRRRLSIDSRPKVGRIPTTIRLVSRGGGQPTGRPWRHLHHARPSRESLYPF